MAHLAESCQKDLEQLFTNTRIIFLINISEQLLSSQNPLLRKKGCHITGTDIILADTGFYLL